MTVDTLFLFTDGLTEAFASNGDQFGDEHLMDVLKSMQTRTVEDILFGVEEQLNDFIGDEPLGDDLTMMVLQMV